MITANRTIFDEYENRNVYKYTLTNDNGTHISVLDFGATWNEYTINNSIGNYQNILLNAPDMSHYLNNPFYLGASIGRVTGRIGNGKFQLNEKTVTLQTNEGSTTLHGGPHGFAYLFWQGSVIKDAANNDSLVFTKNVNNKLDSFPGSMSVKIIYKLNESDQVTITYEAISDEDTLFSPTCHAYFNLNQDNKLVSNHELKANIQSIEKLDSTHVPNGKLVNVKDTVYDFQHFKNIGQTIQQIVTEKKGSGLDDTFRCDGKANVTLQNPQNNLALKVTSDREGVTLFTANGFDKTMLTNKGIGQPYLGIAIEPQILSNAINYPNLGNMIIKSGVKKTYWTTYSAYQVNN